MFVGIERGSAVFTHGITNPVEPTLLGTVVDRDLSTGFGGLAGAAGANPGTDQPGRAGGWGTERVGFISAADSLGEGPVLAVGYEVSGAVAVFEVVSIDESAARIAGAGAVGHRTDHGVTAALGRVRGGVCRGCGR